MSDAPGPLGKIAPGQFERVIAPHLGAARAEVRVGPRAGQDSAIVRLGGGRVLAVTTDPLSVVPALGFKASARLSCHLIASDLWTTGIAPAWASITFNLPPQMSDADLETYWLAMSDEWERLGVAVVTGHTGRYAGCDYSIIGAGTLMGVGEESGYLTPAMARPGDRVIVTKGCAIEATAIAAWLFPKRLGARLGADGVERARALLGQVSVVADCRAALRVGVRERGVTALHDATEGGVLGGLLELARACGHDLAVERARIPLTPEARGACEVFGTDPYWTLSEGTLIAAVRPAHGAAVLEALAAAGIPAAEVGEVVPGCGRLSLGEPDGTRKSLTEPEPDPYWPAYQRAVAEGWE
jgi:hydrogenase expression/formation protein HypE